MTVLRGFAITIASGVAFGCVGAFAGYALGSVVPDYYRTVSRPTSPSIRHRPFWDLA